MTSLSINIDKKVYSNGTWAIADMLFSVQSGELLAIVGPSGSGKTTLLNIVAGIDPQFEGELLLNGQDSATKPGISFMFQDARLLPWLTVQQNIELVLDKNNRKMHSRMTQLLKKVGLQDVRHSYPAQLSGGMKRRVSMVRAFVTQPQLLLMDEPFQSVDEPTANELRAMLLELWQQTKPTILFVTHSLREALSVADRIIFLTDSPAKVILDYMVDACRPRQLEGDRITALHSQLLSRYPCLLSGSLIHTKPTHESDNA